MQGVRSTCNNEPLKVTSIVLVHFDTGAEGDYVFASLVRKTSHELKIFLRTSFEPYFIPREPNNHIKVMILRLEWYKITFTH